jgi:hypothetical protein
MTKHDKLYYILKCPKKVKIPTNDMNAWEQYPQYNWIYNRLEIAKFQNVPCAPLPVEPKKYPVIIKPVINLYGMGLHIQKVNNKEEFYGEWNNNGFWMEYFEGEQYSYDIIILKGEIQYYVCFHGVQNEKYKGCFQYWKSVKVNLPNIIKQLIGQKMKKYTGCLNVEMIGDHMIECHLRMGDIDIFPTNDILNGVIAIYQNKKYDWNKIKVDTVYFFPLWIKNKYTKKLYNFLKSKVDPLLKQNQSIHEFDIDETTLCGPNNCKRVLHFTCSDKQMAFDLLESIRKFIKENNLNINFI